jgi:hypothetical protein
MPETYSVFAKFRHRRLTLMRRIPKLSAAIEFAERIRQLRFHDPDTVFIVDDRTGEIVADREAVEPEVDDDPSTGARRSSPSMDTRVQQTRSLTLAEQSLSQGVSWARQAQRELPSLGLEDAIARIEKALAEVAKARALLEGPTGREKPRAG